MKQEDAYLQERMEMVFLYDFYGGLLKENARQMLEAYICDDCSLREIAEAHGITRQGVHDAIKRASKQLLAYEQTLGLVQKFRSHKEIAKEIAHLVSGIQAEAYKDELEQILQLTRQLAEDV